MNGPLFNKHLSRISSWGKFAGISLMVMGGLSALLSLTTIIGAIPGVVLVFLGYFLFKVADAAGRLKEGMLADNDGTIDENLQLSLYDNLGKFILTAGIMLIISFVLLIIGIILVILGIAAFFPEYYF